MDNKFEAISRATEDNLYSFAEELKIISRKIGFKISSRGWCYQLEVGGHINKGQFDRVEHLINTCRKKGILPIDFTAEEEGRRFSGVEAPNENTPIQEMKSWIEYILNSDDFSYTPDWWDGEKYYIQMLVEKIDLKTLFLPICKIYHIPVATSKGWSSMLQRAIYARRFKNAQDDGLQPVLLYCGDHDPDGLRISDFISKNLVDLQYINWENGNEGYNPAGLKIVRFGLDADFIDEHHLTWIENLITGSGRNLASPTHKNYKMPYVQDYIRTYGVKKCEANAIVPYPDLARGLVEGAIRSFLGDDAQQRFREKKKKVTDEISEFRRRTGLNDSLQNALDIINREENDSDEE